MRDAKLDDAALIERLRAGDERAWGTFLERYERLIYAVPRRMGFDRDDAADILQETAIAFLRGLTRLRDPATVPRWLTRTAYRIARDRRARQSRERRADDPGFWETIEDPAPEADEVLDAFRAREEVRAALALLPDRCQELLSLLFLNDPPPSYAEISRQLGQPIGSLGPTRQRCLDQALRVLTGGRIKTGIRTTSSTKTPRRAVTNRRP